MARMNWDRVHRERRAKVKAEREERKDYGAQQAARTERNLAAAARRLEARR